ncbi:CDP-glycerol:poly(glycerophosphate) glycerophosphotransferase [Microlunatus soli]|uniref:CDP-glycerol:poly(Glycerophosphate) glycerophosphotransferase n=1 Tax=Microlunatus soli TaxID=630515 RepID=A0A1H1M8M2_9ACTN|nr:CDP-glycerol:poly(glycerophosphate) glycerophosphotransferase [Microlunatus soli]
MLPSVRRHLAGKYREHVHPALRATLRRARARRSEQQSALVSIVIPIYNVEEYLDECLTSVIEQTYRNLEIIVVDDGSPDGSYEIAKSYTRWDPRIRIIRQPNRGLGAARNTGIADAHGRYLCFADSDDTLPQDAIARMVESLGRTGSDFAVGAPIRMADGRTWSSGWVKDVHAVDRPRLTLDEFPEILKDVFAWNKLFRADFFHRVVGAFPEDIRYEDQEATAKAYVAGTFDVLAAPVYYWRLRGDGTSITQQKSDPADLHDRLIVKNQVSEVISNGASKQTHDVWLAKAIGFDLRSYFEQIPRTDEAFFQQLRDGVRALNSRMTPDIWRLVPIIDRIPARAVLAGNRDDAITAVTQREEYGWFVPGDLRDGAAYLGRRYLEEMQLERDDALLRLADADVKVMAKATSVWWHDHFLRVEGHAYLSNLAYDPDVMTTRMELVSENEIRVPLKVRNRRDERLDLETKDSWNSHAESGFAVDIDPTELPIGATDPWRVEITVTAGKISRTAVLRDCDIRGIGGTRPVAPAHGNVRWMAGFEDDNFFSLRHTTELESPVSELTVGSRGVTITVADAEARSLRLTCRSLRRTVEIAGSPVKVDGKKSGHVRFTVSLPELVDGDKLSVEHVWSIRAHGGQREPRRLTYPGNADQLHQASPEHRQLRATMTRAGTLRIAQNRWWAVADDVSVEDETVTVTGRIGAPGASGLQARMVGDSQIIAADKIKLDGSAESFAVRFPFNLDGRIPSTRHGFSVRLSVWLDGRRQERWLKVSDGLQHRFPADADSRRFGVTMTRTKKAAGLWLRFRPRYATPERGRLAQRRLHEHYRLPSSAGGGLTTELRDAVLFESFNGRNVGDSVLAIYHELLSRNSTMKFFWSVSDLTTPVPEGATPLLVHTQEWMDVLHNARYLVNNSNFPFYYRKRPGQTYIQTWHGTPLKKIGNDVPGANLSLSYRQLMRREPHYWDSLLAQNDFAATTLPRAFGYAGPVVTQGYPRNDMLTGPDAQLRRKQVRLNLGLTDENSVVLYAPTWRDNVSVSTGYALVSHLDFAKMRKAIGQQTSILLRGHANTAHQASAAPEGVTDVTRYPDINDLLLASDVLITDYSSVMFDYAVTGKPMLFLTPDIDEYRNVTRGFYLDFEKIAPGPLCRTNDDLIAALRDLPGTTEAFRERYRRFAADFTARDDGNATRRVVDTIWGPAVSG